MSGIQQYPISEANWFFSSVRRLDLEAMKKFEKYLPESEQAIQPVFKIFEEGIAKLASLASEAKAAERRQVLTFLSKRFLTPQMGCRALAVVVQAVQDILDANPKDTEGCKLVAKNVFHGATLPVVDQQHFIWPRESRSILFTFLVELVRQNKKAVWPVIAESLVEVLKASLDDTPFTEIDTLFLIPIDYKPQKDELSAYYYMAKGSVEKVLDCGEFAAAAICRYINFYISKGWEIKPKILSALVDSGDSGIECFLSHWANRSVYSNRMKLEPVVSGLKLQEYLLEKPEKLLLCFMNIANRFSEKTAGIIISAFMSVYPTYGQQFFSESVLDHGFKMHTLWYAKWVPESEPEKSQFEMETQQWQQKIKDDQLLLATEFIKNGDYLSAGKVGSWGVMALYRELVALISLKRANLSWSHESFNETAYKKLEGTREQIGSCAKAISEYKWQLDDAQKQTRNEIQLEITKLILEKEARIKDMPLSSYDQDENNAGPFEDHPGVDTDYFSRKCKETELKYQREFFSGSLDYLFR